MADRMSLTTVDTRETLFDVEGYAATKEMANDCSSYFESEVFSVGGYDWAVRYYPQADDPFISILLVLHNKPTDDRGSRIGAVFECAMLDSFGEPSTEIWDRASYVFSSCSEENGFWEYAAEPAVEDPDLLVGDCFTLSYTVSVLKKPHHVTC